MSKRFGRLAAIVLSIAIILSAFPLFTFVFAATYSVGNATEFKNRVVANANDSSLVINITADFTITEGVESDFAGKLNGNGHVITLKSGTALFNEVKQGATIKELGVLVPNSSSVETPANSREYCGIFANAVNGTISDCFAYGSVNVDFSNGKDSYVGGFCGSVMEKANISNTFSSVTIVSNDAASTGGFAGIIRSDDTKGTPTITNCYSAGTIDVKSGFAAGFANIDKAALDKGTITNTYTSCQLVNLSNDALPSGVNGLYDNQLSLMRESVDNPGQTTMELMKTTKLSDAFTVTSTTYPALKNFFDNKWSKTALDVVEVSVAAASFSDVVADSRKEPADVVTRADYLPYESYVDRTNIKNLSWTTEGCKIYDAVPITSHNDDYSAGTGADLLRSRFVFSAKATNQKMTASKNGVSRSWYLSAYDTNPYFAGGDGRSTSTPYTIKNTTQLNNVRFYSLITNACYRVTSNFTVGNFDPIVDFIGNFNGYNKTLSGLVLNDDRDGNMGLFANTRDGSNITNVILSNPQAISETDKITGALIGSAVGTKLSNIVIKGSQTTVSSTLLAGGVVGKAENCTMNYLLANVNVDAPTVGGLVGSLVGGKLQYSGSTGLVGGQGQLLGGLVGMTSKGTSNASIAYCYSTAAVLSKTSNAVAGGLVGNLAGASVTYSYSASVAAVQNASGVFEQAKPLVGSGSSAASSCSYDGQFYQNDTMVVSAKGTASNWNSVDGCYPQIAYFVDKAYAKDLSLVSTTKFIYQHYWEDSKADDLTTGFIPSTFSQPTVATEFCSENVVSAIYTVESTEGYGFQPASNAPFVAMKAIDDNEVAVRYAVMFRNDVVSLDYNIVGQDNSPVFVSIAYSKDQTTWNEVQMRVINGSIELYDIPKASYIRVRVWTLNERGVLSIVANSETLTDTDRDGYYVSANTFSDPITVTITLRNTTAPWGVQRDML